MTADQCIAFFESFADDTDEIPADLAAKLAEHLLCKRELRSAAIRAAWPAASDDIARVARGYRLGAEAWLEERDRLRHDAQ